MFPSAKSILSSTEKLFLEAKTGYPGHKGRYCKPKRLSNKRLKWVIKKTYFNVFILIPP